MIVREGRRHQWFDRLLVGREGTRMTLHLFLHTRTDNHAEEQIDRKSFRKEGKKMSIKQQGMQTNKLTN